MTEFKKRTDITLPVISLITIIASAVIIAMSDKLLYFIQDVLQDKVFHRTFNLEKWADTINPAGLPYFYCHFFRHCFFCKIFKTFKSCSSWYIFCRNCFFYNLVQFCRRHFFYKLRPCIRNSSCKRMFP